MADAPVQKKLHILVNKTERDIILFNETPGTMRRALGFSEGKPVMHEEPSLTVAKAIEIQGDYWTRDEDGNRVKMNRMEISEKDAEHLRTLRAYQQYEDEGKLAIETRNVRN